MIISTQSDNDAENNKDLIKTVFYCVEVQLQNIYNTIYIIFTGTKPDQGKHSKASTLIYTKLYE